MISYVLDHLSSSISHVLDHLSSSIPYVHDLLDASKVEITGQPGLTLPLIDFRIREVADTREVPDTHRQVTLTVPT